MNLPTKGALLGAGMLAAVGAVADPGLDESPVAVLAGCAPVATGGCIVETANGHQTVEYCISLEGKKCIVRVKGEENHGN
uniref:Uncharacterized protein n=1 Tax=Candidatus Kentrum sp. LPFa TaxID=2126335 RepID=A0A450WTQ5_9GAMM|nr:MAG: hypothetical protein BECKLPF1236B_GA0070989_12099 [Candidatus Kentron sp. LPFa]